MIQPRKQSLLKAGAIAVALVAACDQRPASIHNSSKAAVGPSSVAPPPDLATVELIERTARLPPTSGPLDGYDRYYARNTITGRKVIVGLYLATHIADERERYGRGDPHYWEPVPPRKGRLHLLANASELPGDIADGGCEEINVIWDVATEKVAGVECNGLA